MVVLVEVRGGREREVERNSGKEEKKGEGEFDLGI